MDVPLSAAIAIAGVLASICGSLIILNLKSIKDCLRKLTTRTDRQDDRITKIAAAQDACKIDCERRFVDSEVFLRETGFQRRSMENLTASVSRLDGKLTVVEKLPEISANIARSVVAEMKNGGP